MNNNRVTNILDLTSGGDPVTKSYEDTHDRIPGPRELTGPKGDIVNRGPKGARGILDLVEFRGSAARLGKPVQPVLLEFRG